MNDIVVILLIAVFVLVGSFTLGIISVGLAFFYIYYWDRRRKAIPEWVYTYRMFETENDEK